MIIYFILLLFVMLLLSGGNSGSKSENSSLYLAVIIMILFAGLRNISVGTDTGNYVYFFNPMYVSASAQSNLEIGYVLLQTIAILISTNYWSLLMMIAIVSVIPFAYLIKKTSVNIRISFFIYITLASYLFFFNGARQGIAASFFAIALVFLLKRKLLWFAFWIFIASLFHRTVIIMLPFYFILHFKYSTFRMIMFSAISFVGLSFLSFFISFFDEDVSSKYGDYIDRGASGGQLLGIFFFIVSILLIYLRSTIPAQVQKLYDVYLNLCVFNSLIYLVVIVMGVDVNFLRFSQYFLAGYILIWPLIFKYSLVAKDQTFKVVIILLHLGFYFIYLGKMSNMIPYLFNQEIF